MAIIVKGRWIPCEEPKEDLILLMTASTSQLTKGDESGKLYLLDPSIAELVDSSWLTFEED